MFDPTPYEPTEAEMLERITLITGKDTSAAYTKILKKFKYYFPASVDEAKHMLGDAAKLLEALSVQDNIAAQGYKDALIEVERNKVVLKRMQIQDSSFMTKVLHYIETEQQLFFTEIRVALTLNQRNPLSMIGHVKYQRRSHFSQTFGQIGGSIAVNFTLPSMLSKRFDDSRFSPAPAAPSPAPSPSPGGGRQRPKRKQRKEEEDGPKRNPKAWWKKKPDNDSPAWDIPGGKSYIHYFDQDTDSGRKNFTLITSIEHFHHQNSWDSKGLCPLYLASGQCDSNCRRTHTTKARLLDGNHSATIAAIDGAFAAIYK